MDSKTLKRQGKLINEHDYYNGGTYLYTQTAYEYGGKVYIVENHPNSTTHTGKSRTYLYLDEPVEELEKYNGTFFLQVISEETYEAICGYFGVSPKYPWNQALGEEAVK